MNLNQITVPSTNVTKAIVFYEKLGLKLIVDSKPNYARFECPQGGATFSIHHVEKTTVGEGVCVYFECDDLDDYVEKLTQKGIKFDELPNDKDWLWREARLQDPEGNKLILYFAGDNRRNPPWKI